VGEQLFESRDLVVQQLCRARRRGVELVAGSVDDLARELDRRQRGAQLVRDVRDEALLYEREFGELTDLMLDAVGHLVERLRERRKLIGSGLDEARREVAVREART